MKDDYDLRDDLVKIIYLYGDNDILWFNVM